MDFARALTYPDPRPPRSYFFHCATGLVAQLVGSLSLTSTGGAFYLESTAVQDASNTTHTAAAFLAREASCATPPLHSWDVKTRVPVLAYGSNAAPEALFRKFGKYSLHGNDGFIPVLKVCVVENLRSFTVLQGQLEGFDVVYAALLTGYGSVPAALQASPGCACTVYVTYLTETQLQIMHRTEGERKH